jgi:uncharacterized membrane protein
MSFYAAVKIVHILGTVLLFGTGLGTAFFLLMAYRSRDIDAIRVTAAHAVIADWLFTAPAVVLQPISGALLMDQLGRGYDTVWFVAVALLYVLTGLCWIPVLFIQYRLRDLARAAPSFAALPRSFHRLMRRWVGLGIAAFTAVLVLVILMVTSLGAQTSPWPRALAAYTRPNHSSDTASAAVNRIAPSAANTKVISVSFFSRTSCAVSRL